VCCVVIVYGKYYHNTSLVCCRDEFSMIYSVLFSVLKVVGVSCDDLDNHLVE
jgi:hypothetical protein